MQSIWLSLLWKEWCEHRWKLAALSALTISTLFLICFTFNNSIVDVFSFLTVSLNCYAFAATFFVAMSVAGGESSHRTMPFLQSLPVPMWQPAAAKLLLACLTLILPLILVLSVIYLPFQLGAASSSSVQEAIEWDLQNWGQPWGIADWYTARTVGTVLSTLSLLLWLSAAGVNRSDEIRAGAVGFLSIAAIWIGFAYLFYVAEKQNLPNLEAGLRVAMPAGPGAPGIFALTADGPSRSVISWGKEYTPYLLTALVGHVVVGAWFLVRFGRVKLKPERGDTGQSAVKPGYSLGLPMRSQLLAIAWKQMRETGPLAAFTLAAILGLTAIMLLAHGADRIDFREIFTQVGFGMTFFVVVVAGIGLYLDDLKPQLSNFWRSRPTNLSLWFVVKYGTGLLVLVTFLGIPLLVVGSSYLNSVENQRDHKELLDRLLLFGWFFVEAYSLSMALQCLVRQPLYAAILTFVIIVIGVMAFDLAFKQPHWSLTVAAMILALVGTVALAWKTVKHDWGWKS